MPTLYRGDLDGAGRRVAVIVSRFSKVAIRKTSIGDVLLEGCVRRLEEAGVASTSIEIAYVPGAYELPLAAKEMAGSRRFDAVVALGAVVRGETPHFEYVAGECARGLAAVALDSGVPIAFGVLTCDDETQAVERAGGKHGHKGIEAAEAALEMANVLARIRRGSGETR
ncbi:MAG TPA: 6,7-dimethyl-8-ribityllumazine synthase [Planctomycetota bacterium]|nr:6,7-dimethyl-8-ribityllumazine synthase [Planctomycetota bacterium]